MAQADNFSALIIASVSLSFVHCVDSHGVGFESIGDVDIYQLSNHLGSSGTRNKNLRGGSYAPLIEPPSHPSSRSLQVPAQATPVVSPGRLAGMRSQRLHTKKHLLQTFLGFFFSFSAEPDFDWVATRHTSWIGTDCWEIRISGMPQIPG